jgi:hypothetical protein
MFGSLVEPGFLKKNEPGVNAEDLVKNPASKRALDKQASLQQLPPPKRAVVSSVALTAAEIERRENNKRKNAGKVKGEFKKKSETKRGGGQLRVFWD